MRIHIIACRVLTRELSALVADCPNSIDITWLPQGMHDTPQILHENIVRELERLYELIESGMEKKRPDVIVLGYGLCSNATVGITAKDIPIVVPRTDDCIGIFLGSEARYLQYFHEYPGTYWLNAQWVEGGEGLPVAAVDIEKRRAELMEEYDDEEAVDFLLEMEAESLKNYQYLGFIRSERIHDEAQQALAREYAACQGLEFVDFQGSNRMLRELAAGDFREEDFLVVPPGYSVAYSNGPERIALALPAGDQDI